MLLETRISLGRDEMRVKAAGPAETETGSREKREGDELGTDIAA